MLDITDILKILPHRFPFLLIDRVIELVPDHRVVAIKNVTSNEPFFQGHWPDRPIMPGVLILESIAQAAGVLMGTRRDRLQRSVLIASIDDVKLRRSVVPGDQLRIEVEHSVPSPRTGVSRQRSGRGSTRGRGAVPLHRRGCRTGRVTEPHKVAGPGRSVFLRAV